MDFLSNINLKKNTLTKNELKACELILQDLNKVQMSMKMRMQRLSMLKKSIWIQSNYCIIH